MSRQKVPAHSHSADELPIGAGEGMIASGDPAGPAGLPPGFVQGLNLVSVDFDSFRVTEGCCRPKTHPCGIKVDSDITVVVDNDVLGGGPATANTLYHVGLFGDSQGNLPPIVRLIEASAPPSRPDGYNLGYRLGSVRNDSAGNLLLFTQAGSGRDRWMLYDARGLDVRVVNNGVEGTFTPVDLSGFVPSSARLVTVRYSLDAPADTNALIIRVAGSTEATNDVFRPGAATTAFSANQFQTAIRSQRFEYALATPVGASRTSLFIRAYLDELG